jgi:hypothetical protein
MTKPSRISRRSSSVSRGRLDPSSGGVLLATPRETMAGPGRMSTQYRISVFRFRRIISESFDWSRKQTSRSDIKIPKASARKDSIPLKSSSDSPTIGIYLKYQPFPGQRKTDESPCISSRIMIDIECFRYYSLGEGKRFIRVILRRIGMLAKTLIASIRDPPTDFGLSLHRKV